MLWCRYSEVVLPRVLEQVVGCRDDIAQQYLMQALIQARLQGLGTPVRAVAVGMTCSLRADQGLSGSCTACDCTSVVSSSRRV
jgi:Vacuolar protein sorting-associated protein 35